MRNQRIRTAVTAMLMTHHRGLAAGKLQEHLANVLELDGRQQVLHQLVLGQITLFDVKRCGLICVITV